MELCHNLCSTLTMAVKCLKNKEQELHSEMLRLQMRRLEAGMLLLV